MPSSHALLATTVSGGEGPVGQQEYFPTNQTNMTGNWTCPADVYSVSVVCIGGGGDAPNGSGGGLGYKNNIPVVPGQTYAYQASCVGDTNGGNPPVDSWFKNASGTIVCKGEKGTSGQGNSGGGYVGDGGGNGGATGTSSGGYAGSGGGGGYSGNGGAGGSDGGGTRGACGGGTGNKGEGASGSGGGNGSPGSGGGGGGGNGSNTSPKGGDGSGGSSPYGNSSGGYSGGGCSDILQAKWWSGGEGPGNGTVRIIWPGTSRQFPSTRTADE